MTKDDFICPGVMLHIVQEDAFAPYGQLRKFRKGSLFAIAEQEKKDFFYVVSGFVAINYYECTGQWRCQLFAGPGSLGNDAHLLTSLSINPSRYYCNTDCELLWIPAHGIDERKLLTDTALMRNIALSQTIKSMLAQTLLNALTMRSNLRQICWFIHKLYTFHLRNPHIRPAISQQQMASLLGIPERTFKRHINWLKEEGIISALTRKSVAIIAPEVLAALAQPDKF